MQCPICKDEIPSKPRDRHILVSKDFANDHIHIHGDLERKEEMKELIDTAKNDIGIVDTNQKLDRKEVVFHNKQRIGDTLMFTCGVRDFKASFPDVRVNVLSIASHIWDYNPNIDRSLIPTPANTVKIGPKLLTNSSNSLDWHFANAYRVSIEDALKVKIKQGESRPDIYFTREEYDAPRLFKDPYWVISLTGEKAWGCKMYPFERWQEFVRQNPDITFVQIGTKEDNPPRLKGDNIIDHVGQTQDRDTGIRDLFKLFLNAEGSIGLVSFHMHLSGALYKPAIVVAGAREPVSFTRFAGHRYLATDGTLPCGIRACWKCHITACKDLVKEPNPRQVPKAIQEKINANKEKITRDEQNIVDDITKNWMPRCVDLIHPEDLTNALSLYYKGGRLKKDVPSEKPKINNVVKTPPKVVVQKFDPQEKYGLQFGGGCITEKDWEYIKAVIREYKIKSVLEFGSGLSTLLFNDAGLKIITFETNQGWIDKLKSINPKIDIRLWDGVNMPDISPEHPENKYKFDLAFIDGPSGGKSREHSTKIGALSADVAIVHDANREWERKWQEAYIKPFFDGPSKGGNRCHLWIRKTKVGAALPSAPDTTPPAKDCKFIKVVSTARGWGGCARSITTIMSFLLRAGHKVEFIPFRNKVGSKEFQEWIVRAPMNLRVIDNYSTVSEPCDVLFMYADDYVWEFGTPEISGVFSNINAKKKIMMINYRNGNIGQIPWTQGWDKYMFLNSTQEEKLLSLLPGSKTKVLPPCTELVQFLAVEPNYNSILRLIRHSSQGDVKYPKDFQIETDRILDTRLDAEIHLMPAPTFLGQHPKIIRYPKNMPPVPTFLSRGNVFWYSLPPGYMDMGPRVILEAMAAGLPVIADNWGGAKDRVTPETGWLCNSKEEQFEVIKSLTPEIIAEKGKAARERAKKEFVPEKWIEEILT